MLVMKKMIVLQEQERAVLGTLQKCMATRASKLHFCVCVCVHVCVCVCVCVHACMHVCVCVCVCVMAQGLRS